MFKKKKEKIISNFNFNLESAINSLNFLMHIDKKMFGTIYFIGEKHYSIIRNNQDRKDYRIFLEEEHKIIEKKQNTKKFLDEKIKQFSCCGFIPLDEKTYSEFENYFENSNLKSIGIPIFKNPDGNNISYLFYSK